MEHVPHGRPAAEYRALLDGGDLVPRQALEDDQMRPDLEAPAARARRPAAPLAIGAGAEAEEDGEASLSSADIEAALMADDLDSMAALDQELFGDCFSGEDVDGHGGEPILPPPPPPPYSPPASPDGDLGAELVVGEAAAADAAPRAAAVDRVAHPDWPICRGGVNIGSIKYDTVRGFLAAHCGNPAHGKLCRLNRTCRPAARGRPAQGRPLGLLLAWLECHRHYPTKEAHHDITSTRNICLCPHLSEAKRSEARAALQVEDPETYNTLAGLERDRRADEGSEPALWA